MRNPEEREYALACLKLAWDPNCFRPQEAVTCAETFLAFVLGTDTDDAKAKLAVVREAVA